LKPQILACDSEINNQKKMLYMPLSTFYDVFCRHSSGFLPLQSDIAIDLQALTCLEMPSQKIKKARSSLSYD